MAKASEQFRQSDVALWGIVALVLGGVAVLGANVSALLPQGALDMLHKSRLEGPSLEQLRLQVADLREQTVALKRENGVLAARFAISEQQGGDVLRRVGALEVSVPKLLEAIPDGTMIDRSNLTAAIGTPEGEGYAVEGGSVVVRQQPMPFSGSVAGAEQPLPALPAESDMAAVAALSDQAFGVAVGASVSDAEAPATWSELTLKLGPLLFGLSPLLAEEADGGDKRIIVGPIAELSEATALCQRLERIAIACQPLPYAGTPLPGN